MFFIFQALGMCIVFNTCLLVFAGHLVILVYPLAVECDHGTYVTGPAKIGHVGTNYTP